MLPLHRARPYVLGALVFLALHLVVPFFAASCALHNDKAPQPTALHSWRDPLTGCYWLYVAGGTPSMRLDADKKPVCVDDKGNRLNYAGKLGKVKVPTLSVPQKKTGD